MRAIPRSAPIGSCILIFTISINLRLFSCDMLNSSFEPKAAVFIAPAQVPAHSQITEHRLQKICQGIRIDHSILFGLLVRAKRFDEESLFWCTLNKTNTRAFSGVFFSNLHERAPPF